MPSDASPIKLTPLKDVAASQQNGSRLVFVDANDSETRQQFGVIPGATLLTSFNRFDAEKELPADKSARLIFYCANERCTSSHVAAARARSAGYADVAVMPEGIMGWKKAGLSLGYLRN